MMQWFLGEWKFIFFILNFLIGAGLWALSKTYAKKEEVNHIVKKVSALEIAFEAQPNKNEIHNIELQIKEIKGEFHGVKKLLARVSNQLDMLVENELKGSK